MEVKVNSKSVYLFIIILFLTLATGEIYASGQQDISMERAQQLYEESKFDDAILVLTEIVNQDPEKIGEVETLMGKIRLARNSYNSVYEDLLLVLSEEGDYEKALELIKNLEELDSNPNEATMNAVKQVRETITFVLNRQELTDIMDQGFQLISQKLYGEAAVLYTSGFDLYRDSFVEQDYGNVLIDEVIADVDMLKDYALEIQVLEESVKANTASLLDSLDLNNIVTDTDIDVYLRDIESYAALRQEIWNLWYRVSDTLVRTANLRDDGLNDNYLEFILTFINGRISIDSREGILGAVDSLWDETIEPLVTAYGLEAEESYVNVVELFNDQNYLAMNQSLDQSRQLSASALKVLRLEQNRLAFRSIDYGLPTESRGIVERYFTQYYEGLQRVNNLSVYQSYSSLITDIEASSNGSLDTEIQLASNRLLLNRSRQDFLSIQEELNAYQTLINGYQLVSPVSDQGLDAQTQVSLAGDFVLETLNKYETQNVVFTAALDLDPLARRFEDLVVAYTEVKSLLEGYQVQLNNQAETGQIYTTRDPGQAKILITEQTELYPILQDELGTFLDDLNLEPAYLQTDPDLIVIKERGQEIIDLLSTMNLVATQDFGIANDYIFQSDQLRNEGQFRITQVEENINNEDFTTARINLALASDLLSDSLTFQDDPLFRNQIDTIIQTKQDEILQAENAIVVREVRKLIEEGKVFYQQGIYTSAEDRLISAQNKWLSTNTESDTEIEYWLKLVRAALSVESDRVINETDPLFGDMTQLLSQAFSYYERGKILINNREIRDGLEALSVAEEKLLMIQVSFPNNKDASVLGLRIQQLSDPDAFSIQFQSRINDALIQKRTDPQEAYRTLTDLAEIDTNFPGIQDQLYLLKVDLGIIVPPPDPADLSRSTELTVSAAAIIENNIRTRFVEAQTLLDEAIRLNPENERAIQLKDRIRTDVGGQATVVLLSAAQSQYNEALRIYSDQGDALGAYAIVVQLLTDTRNSGYQPLLELERRLKAELGL